MFYSCDDKGVHNATTDTRKLVVNRVFCFGFLMCNDVDGSDVQTRRCERVATGLMQVSLAVCELSFVRALVLLPAAGGFNSAERRTFRSP